MASSEDQLEQGEDWEDQEAKELFDSFIDIANNAENIQRESNGAGVEMADGRIIKEDVDEKEEKNSSTSDEPDVIVDNPTVASESENSQELSSQHPAGNNSKGGENNSDISNKGSTEEESNITKRLSKAVVQLSDLENQLSLMMSSSTESCNSDEDSIVKHPEKGNDEDSSLASTNNEAQRGEGEKVAGTWEDGGDDASTPSNTSDIPSSEGTNIECSADATKSINSETNTADNEVVIQIVEMHSEKQDNKDMERKEDVENLENSRCNDNDEETAGRSKDELKTTSNSNEDTNDETSQEKTKSLQESDSTTDENAKFQEKDDIHQKNEADSNISEDNTCADEGQIRPDQEDGPSLVDSQTNNSQVNSSEDVSNDDTHPDPSTPEIEILMTDESGISERKSLESLDDADGDAIRHDSSGLSDEGIDSDAKSMDDLDDDVAFDSGSVSDLSSANSANLLSVDRNRMGSNSSTVSEREYRTSVELKREDSEDPSKVSVKGYLLKLGGSGLTPRNWRKRWFVLKEDNCLYYYKNSKDKVPCGVIVLCNYSVTKAPDSSKKYCFKLNKGGARTYHLSAASDDEMREWMIALMRASTNVSATGLSFQILEGNVHNVSIPALSIKDPECHGYLSKKGHNIKLWKRRYCVLKNGYLYYYSDMSNTTALGVAKLLGYQINSGGKRGRHFCFYGNPPDESMRTFHFSAETENDRERWMKRLKESIERGTNVE